MSGYVYCACGTCFEIAISGDDDGPGETLCLECEEAGCEPGDECQREDIDDDRDEWHGQRERKESYSDRND